MSDPNPKASESKVELLERDYLFREAREHEQPLILGFLQKNFFPIEHLITTYLDKKKPEINEEEKRNIEIDLEEKHRVMVSQLPCLVAEERTSKQIVGINLMVVEPNPADTSSSDYDKFCEAMAQVPSRSKILAEWFSSVLDYADSTVDFFKLNPDHKRMLRILIVNVDPAHGKRGLATGLIREANTWARLRHIGIVSGLFTSPYSRRAATKNGFKSYNDIDILTLRDSLGNLIYEGCEPYEISVMGKLLE